MTPKINFDPTILKACPEIRLGVLTAQIRVSNSSTLFWEEMETELSQLKAELQPQDIKNKTTIAQCRQAYKTLGKDPSRYRPSAEALLRRVCSGKALYRVNNVVDLINCMSICTGFSIGSYDLQRIEGDILMSVGRANDDYQAIGRGKLNIEHLPCLRDEQAAFGSPTSDSVRTSIQSHTTSCLWVYFDFGSHPDLEQSLETSASLLKQFASANDIQSSIILP